MKGFKGFNKQLQCTSNGKLFQYEIGKTYTEPTASLCFKGFHFCCNPLDVFSYYSPANSRYTKIDAADVSDETTKEDSKRVAMSITIGAEFDLRSLIGEAVKFIFSKTGKSTTGKFAHSATTGNYAHSATTGESAHSATTGCSANSATTGKFAHSATTGKFAHSATTGKFALSSVSGKNTIAASLGVKGKAKGTKGSFLVLAEYGEDRAIKAMGIAIVRGKIKPDTFYVLKDGKFVESK